MRVTGGNLIARRQTIESIGFDARMRTAEDILFLHRLDAAGITSTCLPGLVCIHHESKGLGTTIAWMFESGISATHQLLRFRPPRVPDMLLVGGIAVIAASGIALGKKSALVAAGGWLIVSSSGHIARCFTLRAESRYVTRFAAACVINVPLIGSYFLGRFAGLVTPNRIVSA
jgi:hypothetical protein